MLLIITSRHHWIFKHTISKTTSVTYPRNDIRRCIFGFERDKGLKETSRLTQKALVTKVITVLLNPGFFPFFVTLLYTVSLNQTWNTSSDAKEVEGAEG